MEVLLLHGWATNPRMHWFPYIKREIQKRGIVVRAPNLPRSTVPNFNDWSWIITKSIMAMKPPNIVIAHSLGGLALLRTLEEIKLPTDYVVFIGTPLHLHAKRKFLNRFFKKRYRWAVIRKNIKHGIVIHARNDQWVSLQNGKEIAKQLGIKLITPKTGGHFQTKKFPLLKELIINNLSLIRANRRIDKNIQSVSKLKKY